MVEGSQSDSPDWSYLPQAVLHLISEKVKSITDYCRFRSVCSPWRSASLPKPRHYLPPQLPWLMIPYNPHRASRGDDGIRLFYDLFESKMRKLHLPETVGLMCCATCRGWLLLVATRGTEIFLLNPITRARVQLPSFTAPVKDIKAAPGDPRPGYDARHCFEPYMGNFAITRVTFSTDLADPDCLITVFIQRCWGIFCCRVGDPCWTMVNIRPDSFDFADVTYYNGLFYLLHKGAMSISDPNNPDVHSVCFFDEELRDASMFLLEGKSGVYMVAVHDIKEGEEARGQKDENGSDPAADDTKVVKQKFELYQFQEHTWKLMHIAVTSNNTLPGPMFKITDTGDTTIFFGDNYHGLAVCSDDWDLLDGGSMYMEYKRAQSEDTPHGFGSTYSIYCAKLDGGKFEPVVCDFAKEPEIWPPAPAMWFQPSYC